jgi:chitinase
MVKLFYKQPSVSGVVSSLAVAAGAARSSINTTSSSLNQSPQITLTSPTTGAEFVLPATITITATANDPDGSIAKVEFYQGATKLGEATTPPYIFVWSGFALGDYSLTAKAYDNLGASAVSNSVLVSVTAIVDTDLNGLPDDWERTHFGNIGVNPNADPDGDGLTNLQEFQQGTNPNDFYNGVSAQVQLLNNGAPGANDDLTIKVRKPDGTPWPGAPGVFQITAGGRYISATLGGPNYTSSVSVRTDAQGLARVYLEPLTP